MVLFDELTDARRLLYSFCLLHEPSLLSVRSGISFKLHPTEPNLGDSEVRHLTTSATCLASLLECPERFRTSEFEEVDKLRDIFGPKALARNDWTSEDSAHVYCICRALPLVIDLLPNSPAKLEKRIENHLSTMLGQLEGADRFGIGEANPKENKKRWYPPNAFHTYWAIDILTRIKTKYSEDYARLSDPGAMDLERRRTGMLLWGRQTLGAQIGLHSASPQSSVLDSDQLGWSLAIFLRFDERLNVNLETRDFIKQALACLFSTQVDGTWRHYKPLFHYLDAGNAYCYVFETFAVLLHCAVQTGDRAEMLRALLKPYWKNLLDLWRYADSTKIDLQQYRQSTLGLLPIQREFGWCSGHRTNITDPESWATASVFSYAQALRRLLGIWCNEEALAARKTPGTRYSPEKAAKEMIRRGNSWGHDKPPVFEQLWTMFMNPVRMQSKAESLEPDSQPIKEHQARSAILFGPPGASKTTLVRRLADVIGWEYVEIHASHFVAEGLPEVQRTADKIFKQLIELDHVVVLFDEIDELVRERDMEKDAFGRFLTTSMLPKLAELWEKRKIIYFVATNHINYFDSAIIRSNRFDALIFVSPPSFDAKIGRLRELLSSRGIKQAVFAVSEKAVNTELRKVLTGMPGQLKKGRSKQSAAEQEAMLNKWLDEELDPELSLAKLALMRWDELDELAYRLSKTLPRDSSRPITVSLDAMRSALRLISDSQWRKNKSYADYVRDENSERRDYQMAKVWEVSPKSVKVEFLGISESNNRKWLTMAVDSLSDVKIQGHDLVPIQAGSVEIIASGPPSGKHRRKSSHRKRK